MKGSVRKPRTDGGRSSYRLDLGLDDRGRRRQQEVGGFRTKKDAQTALNEALADRQRGTYAPPSETTVRDFPEEGHEGARTELALTAWTNYGQIIRRNINQYLGSKRPTDLSPMDIKRWHGKLLESGRRDGEGRSVASVKLAHRIVRRALADACAGTCSSPTRRRRPASRGSSGLDDRARVPRRRRSGLPATASDRPDPSHPVGRDRVDGVHRARRRVDRTRPISDHERSSAKAGADLAPPGSARGSIAGRNTLRWAGAGKCLGMEPGK